MLGFMAIPITLGLLGFLITAAAGFQPEFAEPIVNLTVPLGRNATFRCLVVHLGGYRVGWVKADTKAIQAIHDHVITHNPRVSVSHNDHSTWNLHIRSVQEEDKGQYMCQINTDPMKSQIGTLEVVIPPDFIAEDTSGDVMVPEGATVRLTCRARGMPEPRVSWRREDGNEIVLREAIKSKLPTFHGEVLKLSKITRSEMGAYFCIASNGVTPSVSKRIMVTVQFHPVIQVPNQLVGAPIGTDVTLECYVEAMPKSINYWLRDTNEMVISSSKYVVHNAVRSLFESKMSLTVKKLQTGDAGGYRCIAKNSLGEVESNIRLYEIPGSTRRPTESIQEEIGEFEYGPPGEFGSSEEIFTSPEDDEDDEDEDYSITVKPKDYSVNLIPSSNRDAGSQSATSGRGKSVVHKRDPEPTSSAGVCKTCQNLILPTLVYICRYWTTKT